MVHKFRICSHIKKCFRLEHTRVGVQKYTGPLTLSDDAAFHLDSTNDDAMIPYNYRAPL